MLTGCVVATSATVSVGCETVVFVAVAVVVGVETSEVATAVACDIRLSAFACEVATGSEFTGASVTSSADAWEVPPTIAAAPSASTPTAP